MLQSDTSYRALRQSAQYHMVVGSKVFEEGGARARGEGREVTACTARVLKRFGDVVQLVERRIGTPLTRVRFPGAAKNFSPRVDFLCRLSDGDRTPKCAIACINISHAHIKDFVVHVRVRWIIKTLRHPACPRVG